MEEKETKQYKPNTESQKKADLKELNKEPLKETLQAKTTNQALSIIAQELLDLSIDLKLKGAPSQAERLRQLSDLAQERLTEQGINDKRREPEVNRARRQVTTFKPVVDQGRPERAPQRKVTRFEAPGKRESERNTAEV